MFLVKVLYKCVAGKREIYHAEALAAGIIDAVRNEEGNLAYDYAYMAEAGNDILLLELWESPEDWDAHKATPHVEELQAIKAKYVLETIVESFIVSKA